MRTAYGASTRVLSALLGGPLALGVVLGTLLALLGAGRFWLASARGGER